MGIVLHWGTRNSAVLDWPVRKRDTGAVSQRGHVLGSACASTEQFRMVVVHQFCKYFLLQCMKDTIPVVMSFVKRDRFHLLTDCPVNTFSLKRNINNLAGMCQVI